MILCTDAENNLRLYSLVTQQDMSIRDPEDTRPPAIQIIQNLTYEACLSGESDDMCDDDIMQVTHLL